MNMLMQGVVTFIIPVEPFSTRIKTFDSQKFASQKFASMAQERSSITWYSSRDLVLLNLALL